MALDVINPIQNTSYVNRDFESIYPELLDLVKQLTYKWDPSISNESDPGVILLKLNAIIADKLSYNLDKNILECFPLSVTQEGNARQLFEQLGYYMKWYRGATVDVALKWKSTPGTDYYTIPAFTMVSDADNNIVYALIGPSISSTSLTVSNQSLSTDGTILIFRAIQGIPVKYDINGETLIRFSALDSNRRIYFNSSDIAQNGIFITNKDENNYSSWHKVDNLTVQSISSSNRCFKFGVTTDGTTCYLEFPDNAESIFGEGIEITYIRTLGENGNISPRVLEKFYQDLVPIENNGIILNSDNVIIANISSASNGANPETINQAYRGYKRTIGTFDTLVTLRDYFNYIVSAEGLVSNAVVADRTNDIQSAYKIVSNKNLVQNVVTQVETSASDEPLLTAYSLKLYLLKYQSMINSEDAYNRTFEMMNNYEKTTVEGYTQNSKSIQHDYEKLISGKIAYILNKYPISCNITTQNPLTETEASDVTANIKLAIYQQLNSQEIDFGEEVPIDLIKNVILSADKRIKDVTFNTTSYNTYAVVYNETEAQSSIGNGTFEVVPIYGEEYESISALEPAAWEYKRYSVGDTVQYKLGIYECIQNNPPMMEPTQLSEYWTYVEASARGYSNQFQEEIVSKSILAGATQLYVEDTSINFQLSDLYRPISPFSYGPIENIESIYGTVEIPVSSSVTGDVWSYTLRQNEILQFYAPNLINAAEYSNYVRYEYVGPTVPKDTSYELKENECIIFYWQDAVGSVYKYTTYAQGCIIKPSFDLVTKQLSDNRVLPQYREELWPQISSDNYLVQGGGYVRNSDTFGNMSSDASQAVSGLSRSNALSGSNKVVIQAANQITLSLNDDNYYCYWILNSSTNNRYVLFDASENEQDYILDTGEYFFFTNPEMSQLTVLGAGTKISKTTTGTSRVWSVPVKNSSLIMQDGMSAFSTSDWFKLNDSESCSLTENQYYNFNEGTSISIAAGDSSSAWPEHFTNDPEELDNFVISYKTPSSTSYIDLPTLDLGTIGNWYVRGLLNMNFGPQTRQYLLNNQFLFVKRVGEDSYTQLSGQDMIVDPTSSDEISVYAGATSYPVSILATENIYNSSSTKLTTNPDTFKIYLSNHLISIYNDTTTNIQDITYQEDGTIIINVSPMESAGTILLPRCLAQGHYILSIFIPPNVTITPTAVHNQILYIMDSGNIINPIASHWATESGIYYYDIFAPDLANQPLVITIGAHSEEFILTLLPLYKYNLKEFRVGNDTLNIDLSKYDVDNLYDYTYVVDSDDEIENPLDSESFFKLNHPYNAYTISQFDTSDRSSIKILGKRK